MTAWTPVLAATGSNVTPSVTPSIAGEPAAPSTEATRREFAALCARFRSSNDPFFGRRVVDELRAKLAAPIRDPSTQVGVRARLGMELLRLGQPQEAIKWLEEARTRATDLELPAALRQRLVRDLAMAHLRAAETENCVEHHRQGSCILPIAADAIHIRAGHTRRAGDLYATFLAERPDSIQMRWLLNLARMTSGDFPAGVPEAWRLDPALLRSSVEIAPWRNIAPDLGIATVDLAGGASMDDFDGDGLLDLITSTNDPCGPMRAFRNDGRGGFEDVSKAWGLDAQWGGLNFVHADYDGDRRIDLLVLRGGWWGDAGRIRNSLLRNEIDGPRGRFVDVTVAAGLGAVAYPTQTAAFADADGDGDLDLFIGNEATPASPHPPQLFENRGDGTFRDVTVAAGLAQRGFTKGVAFGDVDNDGDPDLYVSNIGTNRLFRNDTAGERWSFVDVTEATGTAAPIGGSFAAWFFDHDNDGDLDLFVTDYSSPYTRISAALIGLPQSLGHPVLYRNDSTASDIAFVDISQAVGLTQPALPMGANYGDFDNDGWLDIYLGTGVPDFEALMPNLMLRNNSGKGFDDVTFAGGFGHLQKGHGVAWGDLDNDGDQDLFHQLGGQFPADVYGNALFENPGSDHTWITLRLESPSANRFAVGARVAIETRAADGSHRTIHAVAGTGGSFGGSSLQLEIGLGAAVAIEALAIRWPSTGTSEQYRNVEPKRVYRAVEGAGRLVPIDVPRLLWPRSAEPHHVGSSAHSHRPSPSNW